MRPAILAVILAVSLLAGCGQPHTSRPGKTVVATTAVLADLVRQVAGDRVSTVSLIPPGADPHTYEPTLRGMRSVVYADAAFSNYLMLEPHSVMKSIEANLPKNSPHVSLAEAATDHGAEVIPLVENARLETLWLGLRARGGAQLPKSAEVEFSITHVDGPGQLTAYLTGTFGQPRIFSNSADGFDERNGYRDDSMRLPVDAHTHMSWAFSVPGVYRAQVRSSLIEDGKQPQQINNAQVTFVVGQDPHRDPAFAGKEVLDIGHADICADLGDKTMYFWADPKGGGDSRQQRKAFDQAIVWVPPKALQEIPAATQFRFLGRSGQMIYQLPQAVLGAHVHGEIDPHLWHNVRNAKAYVRTIRDVLVKLDPPNANTYVANTARYEKELDSTEAYVQTQLATIAPERRYLITTHDAYGYLAQAYGLKVAGFVAPNPGIEPSMTDRRRLTETLRSLQVPAVFLEPTLARESSVLATLAADEHVAICPIYSDTFDRKVTNYLQLMRFNTDSLVRCLGKN